MPRSRSVLAKDPVTIYAKINNTTKSEQTASVSWQIAKWDNELSQNVVQEKSETVTIPANGGKDISITVYDTEYPAYVVLGTLQWHDTRSVIGARFVRSGVERARINFPAVTHFPLMANENATLFSCLHNIGEGTIKSGRLVLTLSDTSGKVIHEKTYTGDITGAMMGVAEQFIPKRSYDAFNIDAKLYQGDKLVDESHATYDCRNIDPSLCFPRSNTLMNILC